MVLLPLPLSPASATISREPMVRFTSSTACRMRRDSALPILKCLLSASVRSSGPESSATVSLLALCLGVQQAAHLRVPHLVQVWLGVPAEVHHARAARREPAAMLWLGQVRWPARDTGQRHPLAPDRGEGFEQSNAVGVARGVEDLPGAAVLGDLAGVHHHEPLEKWLKI